MGTLINTIRLSERASNPDGSFQLRVAYPDGSEYEVTITDPASETDEALFAWYFEQHLRYPFLDLDRRAAAVAGLREYGEELFSQVFGSEAGHRFRDLRERGFDGCRIDVTGSAALHRLHWETLRDPTIDDPLAIRLPITRRVDLRPAGFVLPDPRPTLNILLVTARPDGARDVGYRTISRPLLDALRQASLPVTVDLVRPGTWSALRDHLREVKERHGSGWYHLVHFDVHGAFADYSSLHAGQTAGSYLFTAEQLPRFEGKQGFLFFETAHERRADPRSARQVASLLAEHRVPMAVLNACQSAMQSASEAALAQQLVDAGVPVVVGMAYSVTVTAAALAMPALYNRLAHKADADQALLTMRQRLFDDPIRDGYFDQQLPLHDWTLPVVFQQQPVQLTLRPMDDQEAEKFYAHQATVGDEPSTEYGFVGRDLDIQAIERLLLVPGSPNQVLVRGMAGAGKSTLLAHLGWWWQRTGLIDQVFTFSYEQRAWTADQIMRAIASKLWQGVEFARWEQFTELARRERVAEALRSTRHLLMIDNAESITASPAAIPHALSESQRDSLRQWLARLRGGRTLVVWGSREAEQWAARDSFGSNVYELGGLDPQAASVLTDRILTHHGVTHYRDDPNHRGALAELIDLLGRYPLPLEVVLPVLTTTPPRSIVDELSSGGEAADPVGLIRRAIEYSHGKLDPALQNSLLMLAPFVATVPGDDILAHYQELLNQHQPTEAGWGAIDLSAGLAAAVEIGLATEHEQLEGWAHILPVLPYFLRQRLHQHPEWWAATRQAHYDLCTQLGKQLHQLMRSPDPGARATGRAVTQAGYANLVAALGFAVERHQPVTPIVRPLEEYLDHARQQTARRQLLDETIAALAARPDQSARRELMNLYHFAGMAAQQEWRFEQAEGFYGQALELALEFGERENVVVVYHQLGMAAHQQRRFEQAEDFYGQALKLTLESGERHTAATIYHQLGMVAQDQRRFEQAEDFYGQSLKLKLEFGDRHGAAGTYGQLGMVAQDQRRFEQAADYYRQALDIYLEFNNRHEAANVQQHRGSMAREQGQLEQAEGLYRQALDIYLEFNDRLTAAGVYGQLGEVALRQGRFQQAEDLSRQALDIYLEFNDRHMVAATYHQLGTLAQAQRQPEQAEAHYRQALLEYKGADDDRSASQTATSLGSLLVEIGRHAEALDVLLEAAVGWRRLTGDFDQDDLRLLGDVAEHVDAQTFEGKIDSFGQATATELRERLKRLGEAPEHGASGGGPGSGG